MQSVTTEKFRKCFKLLPVKVKEKAKRAYTLWRTDPHNSSLNYKLIHSEKPIYSVRVGFSYRALGVLENDVMIWFWIGSHEDYNTLINQLK